MPKGPWTEAGIEPRIRDLLNDPIVQTLMRADGVRVADVLAIIFKDNNRSATRKTSSGVSAIV
jgi:hypothetical protein